MDGLDPSNPLEKLDLSSYVTCLYEKNTLYLQDYQLDCSFPSWLLLVLNWVFFISVALLQVSQFVSQVLASNTGLMLEIQWLVFTISIPILALLYLFIPEAQIEVMFNEPWAVWVLDLVYAGFIYINWDIISGNTAEYFKIISSQYVYSITMANTIVGSLSISPPMGSEPSLSMM